MIKKAILYIAITVLKFLANLIYLFMKLFPVKSRIIMITRQSNNVTLDFRLLKEYIEKTDNNIEIKIFAKKLEKGIYNKILYILYTLKVMKHLATSKVCVIDSYCIPVSILKHKKKLKIIQIWHASGAVKKFGHQILDKKEGSSKFIAKLMCMHKNYDFVIAPSERTKKIFAEAFNIQEEKIVKFGLPRLEYIYNSKYDKSKEILEEYPRLKNKKNIVYIPTFRKNQKTNLNEILNYKIDKQKYNLIISLHPLDSTKVPEEYLVDKKFSSFDLIKIADYIITDYSALSIEASILEKPIFIYLYDYEKYTEIRGLNIYLNEELKTFTTNKFSDIMTKIEEKNYDIKELIDYKNKYIEINPESSIEDLGNFLLKQIRE